MNEDNWNTAEVASFDYEPWPSTENKLPTTEGYIQDAPSDLLWLRLGYLMCTQSKADNNATVERLGGDATSELVSNLGRLEANFRGFADIAATAHARLLVSMAVMAEKEGQS